MEIIVDPVSLRLAIVCMLALLVCDYVYRLARTGTWDEIKARLKALGVEVTWWFWRRPKK